MKYHDAKTAFERFYIRQVIPQSNGNLAEAARLAGLDRGQFYRLAKKHQLVATAEEG